MGDYRWDGCRRQGMGGGLHANGSIKKWDVGGADKAWQRLRGLCLGMVN